MFLFQRFNFLLIFLLDSLSGLNAEIYYVECQEDLMTFDLIFIQCWGKNSLFDLYIL